MTLPAKVVVETEVRESAKIHHQFDKVGNINLY